MKRLSTIMMCLLAMMAASLSAKAQEVTITLMPGWTWISIPSTETMDFTTALGSFTPEVGDRIKSQWGNATYRGNGEWRGQISEFYPGYGYMYYSTRQVPVTVTFNAQQPTQQVVVTTDTPQFITAISAMGGGEVTTNDGTYILVKGLCWATHENPTTNDDFYEEAESGVGTFSISMTELNIATTYYVRAYAVTPNGTVYGDQKTFTTRDGIPEVITTSATDIFAYSASCGGTVTDDGGLFVMARGICWSTSSNPTINDAHSTNGSSLGSYTHTITGLTPGTTYHVRAYATTSYVTVYGEEVAFNTTSIMDNAFVINNKGAQVYFSQGNLQYQASTNTWRFAEHQWDYVGSQIPDDFGLIGGTVNGSDNHNISPTYNGWIDLFGWGTSGFNHGAVCYQPWSTSQNNGDYYAYGNSSYNLFDQTGLADWGSNAIINGGNQLNQWRTLTREEWHYILNTRTTSSSIRYAKAVVNGVKGLILLPTNWVASFYSLNNPNNGDADFENNIINESDWIESFETNGAIFLPAGGWRSGTSIYFREECLYCGSYWSSSYGYSYGTSSAYGIQFTSCWLDTQSLFNSRIYGMSVRLVCPVE